MNVPDTASFDSNDPAGEGWNVRLEALVETHRAIRPDEVTRVLSIADEAARAGAWAAVAVSYEAAVAFEPSVHAAPALESAPPLAWVGIYRTAHSRRSVPPTSRRARRAAATFVPSVGVHEFTARVRAVQEHIRAGDAYQINLTFPLEADGFHPLAADSEALVAWYEQLRDAQQARYCAHIDLGTHLVLSFSPELFFARRGEVVTARPMKGTTARGRWLQEDEARARALAASEKERAENVMIVDLLRNDIGRVARAGTVRVPELFRLERYPTLWQMTSTVEGRVPEHVPLAALFAALFPCGSVTGAPKLRAMDIITALEGQGRGLYTGAIGVVRPGGDCTFSVAIRTIVIERATGKATMGVGAGITADSDPRREYEECLLKAAFTSYVLPPSSYLLLETLRLDGGRVVRLDRHIARMAASARYFGYRWDEAAVRKAVEDVRATHPDECWRLRLTLAQNGAVDVACSPHERGDARPWRLAYAESPVDERSPFLFNKTTNRLAYDAARQRRPDVDDVLLWNQSGQVTESTIANLVAEIDGVLMTPPVACGLLAGTFRGELIEAGALHERVLTREDLARAPRLWLVNSLRGWIDAVLVP